MKAATRKMLALLLCAALFASLFTAQAFAATEDAAGQEGTFALYSKARDQYFDALKALPAQPPAGGNGPAPGPVADPLAEYLSAYGRALLVYRLGVMAYYEYVNRYEDLRDEWYARLQAERAILEAFWSAGAAKRDADMQAAFAEAKQIEDEAKAAFNRGEITRAEYFRRVAVDKDDVLAEAMDEREETEDVMEASIVAYDIVSEITGDYYSERIKDLNEAYQNLTEEELLLRLRLAEELA